MSVRPYSIMILIGETGDIYFAHDPDDSQGYCYGILHELEPNNFNEIWFEEKDVLELRDILDNLIEDDSTN